jgi:hypothetical protein
LPPARGGSRTTAPTFGHLPPETFALFTDRYELSVMQGYGDRDHDPTATFGLCFRELPPNRGYLVAAGLEQRLAAVEELSAGDRTLSSLADEGFDPAFLDYLDGFAFSSEMRGVPEGTVVFPDEPLVEVTAPLAEAQRLGTLLVDQVGFQSLVATKAARMRDVGAREGDSQTLVDVGPRRAHGVMRPNMKLSSGKATYPVAKRVGRVETNGWFVGDVVGRRDEEGPGRDLLVTVVDGGEVVYDPPSLDAIRETTRRNVEALPDGVRAIEDPAAYESRSATRSPRRPRRSGSGWRRASGDRAAGDRETTGTGRGETTGTDRRRQSQEQHAADRERRRDGEDVGGPWLPAGDRDGEPAGLADRVRVGGDGQVAVRE